VHITSAYFLPDRSLVAALLEAARRGVNVCILLPSVNESPLVLYAGQSLYQELLMGGYPTVPVALGRAACQDGGE
jgi:cardiolipin synthase